MTQKKLEIQGICSMESTTWEGGAFKPIVTIEYAEYGDSWHGCRQISVDIDKEKAIEIINMLTETFAI